MNKSTTPTGSNAPAEARPSTGELNRPVHGDSGPGCEVMQGLSDDALAELAAYFQTLAEPVRLRLLQLLRDGERKVGDLAQACACSSANVSRHLAHLMHQGLVEREARGTAVYYRIADASVYALCEVVCGSIGRRWARAAGRQQVFMGAAGAGPSAAG